MKHFYVFLLVLLLLTASFTATATNTKTYELEELDIKIDIPENLIVFTRSIEINDPGLKVVGLTKADMETLMQDGNIYLNAIAENLDYEIIVTMIESSIDNFSLLSDTELMALMTIGDDEYEERNITRIKTEVYQHSQAKFIKLYISQPGYDSIVYGLQYYTTYNGKAINITLQSYSGVIDSVKEALLKSIVDSTVFGSDPPQRQKVEYSPSFLYTDDNTGVSFTVPENWSQVEFSKERKYLTAKFASNLEEGLIIVYSGNDFWSELSANEKQGLSRKDIDNNAISKSDIAYMYGANENDIKMVKYNGIEYYKAVVTEAQDIFGFNLTVTMTYLCHIRNGYIFEFQFNAAEVSPYYKVFETLLSSVKYPGLEIEKSSNNTNTTTSSANYNTEKTVSNQTNDSFFNSWLGHVIINFIITIIIHPLPIWIYRYTIRKKPVAPKRAKRIVRIDAVIVVFILIIVIALDNGSTISFAAVLLWSRMCYSSLISGYVEESDNREHITETNNPIDEQITKTSVNNLQQEFNGANNGEANNGESTQNDGLCVGDMVAPEVNVSDTDVETKCFENHNGVISCVIEPKVILETTLKNDESAYIPVNRRIRFCRRCGFELLENSSFCSRCGTSIEREIK